VQRKSSIIKNQDKNDKDKNDKDKKKKDKKKGDSDHSSEEKRFREYYELGKVIGRGGFSVVHECTLKKTKKKFAVKLISTRGDPTEVEYLRREIDIMQLLDHPNIVKLWEVFEEEGGATFYLVIDILSGGGLYEGLVARSDGHYSELEVATLLRQILEAIEYMHTNGITHRDLKHENILFNETRKIVKISDFGVSKASAQGQLKTQCGTPDHIAPEILTNQGEYSNAVDLWSFGVIAYSLLCGYPPFESGNMITLYNKIMKAEYEFKSPDWDLVSDAAKNFVSGLLKVDPDERLSAPEALQHPWLKITEGRPNKKMHHLDTVRGNLLINLENNKRKAR